MRTKYLLFGIMVLGLTSCDKIINNKIWDISPVVVNVQVADANGVDLLNPDNQNSFEASGIKAIYKEKEYECNKDVPEVKTKAYMPYFYGLQISKEFNNGTYILKF